MKKSIVESWITTVLGSFIGIFGGLTLWVGKTTMWESIIIWIIAAVLIAADEKFIRGLIDKIPKLK